MNRLILVTGATGYIGTVLVPKIAALYPVRTFDTQHFGNAIADVPNVEHVVGDIRDTAAVSRAVEGVTDVVHLSGIVTDGLVDQNVRFGHAVNVGGTINIARAAVDKGVRRFIYASSSSVYGLAAESGEPDETVTPKPKTEYAEQKLLGEQSAFAICQNDLICTAVRSATACGPAPRMRLDTVVNVFSKQAWFDGKVSIHGGMQYRSNIHVQDVTDLYVLLLDAPGAKIGGEVWNATAENMRVRGIGFLAAKVLLEEFGRQAEVEFVPVEDERSYRLNASKVRRVLGWEPERWIREAFVDNYRFFEQGGIEKPNADIFYNDRRMASVVSQEGHDAGSVRAST
jgi:nucleoside-diphosphate-sugar epimerase